MPTRLRAACLAGVAAALLGAGGCTHIGPRTLPTARFLYNQAVARSGEEQILLNLVRLRYGDTPQFLEVGSVVTRYTFAAGAGASAVLRSGADEAGASANVDFAEEPTVTYAPLQGREFVTQLLSPIDADNLFLLSQSGWSIERLLLCCVQRLNGLPNAVAAAGPTPDYVPVFEDFHAAAAALRRLQIAGRLEVAETDAGRFLTILPAAKAAASGDDPDLRQVKTLLGLDPARDRFRFTNAYDSEHAPDEIALFPRSLLAVMFFLSQAVEPSAADEEAGRVTVTRDPEGDRFDWSRVVGDLLRIRSADQAPAGAAVRVFYRGRWFFVDDSDRRSKATFNLLSFLLAIQAGGEPGVRGPLLTLGVR
jgi:hypothetical protein